MCGLNTSCTLPATFSSLIVLQWILGGLVNNLFLWYCMYTYVGIYSYEVLPESKASLSYLGGDV